MNEWRCERCGQTFEEGPCPAAKREREAERAVIESAKAWAAEDRFAIRAALLRSNLRKAVEALQEAEK